MPPVCKFVPHFRHDFTCLFFSFFVIWPRTLEYTRKIIADSKVLCPLLMYHHDIDLILPELDGRRATLTLPQSGNMAMSAQLKKDSWAPNPIPHRRLEGPMRSQPQLLPEDNTFVKEYLYSGYTRRNHAFRASQ